MTAPQDATTTALVKRLREQVLPAEHRGTGNHIYVYGQTATFIDFADALSAQTPLFFAVIIGLSFLLLTYHDLIDPAALAMVTAEQSGQVIWNAAKEAPSLRVDCTGVRSTSGRRSKASTPSSTCSRSPRRWSPTRSG